MFDEPDYLAVCLTAADDLANSGELDPSWRERITSLLAHHVDVTDTSWSPDFFRAMHFATMYLPLRYRAWHHHTRQRRMDTELTLMEVAHHVEMTLWARAAAVCSAALHEDERALACWVFDEASRLHADNAPLDRWEKEYLRLLSRVQERWRSAPLWPKWPTMAIHFASFLLDIGLANRVLPIASGGATREEDALLLVRGTAGRFVADVLSAWLTCSALERDGSGTVLLGGSGTSGPKTQVRVRSELLLMGPRQRP